MKESKEKAGIQYNEAIRYMANAYDFLKKAKKNGKIYQDVKYVRVACGTAYNAVLLALNGFFILKNIDKPKRKASIEYYQEALSTIDRKMLISLNIAYQILHRDGYYDGFNDIKTILRGFEEAEIIIHKLKISI